MNLVHRTALRIVTRLQAHPHLKLAVTLTRGCFRTFDATAEEVADLGKHYTLIGVFDHRVSVDDLNTELEAAILQWRADHK